MMRLLSRRDPPRTSEQSKGRRGRHARVTRARHRVGTDACRSVHVRAKKKILCVLLNFVANIFCHRLPRVSGAWARTLHERSPAAGVLSRAPQGACTTLLPCDRFHQLPEFGRWAPVGH